MIKTDVKKMNVLEVGQNGLHPARNARRTVMKINKIKNHEQGK